MKLCEHDNCRKEASYAYYFMKPIYCKTHKKDNMKTKKYICTCGKSTPSYGLENDVIASCCKECRTDIMIDLKHKKCICGKARPSFGLNTDTKPTCCKECRTDKMENIVDKKCKCGKARPSFGEENKTAICCKECKTDIMIDLIHKKCICGKARPRFGLKTDKNATCCKECRTDKMENIVDTKCICGKAIPCFGLESDKKRICCKECKTDKMVNLKDKKCVCGKAQPTFRLEGDTSAKYCKECKTEEMCSRNRLCKSNFLEKDKKFECSQRANKKYKNFCARCYAFHFPLDPLTFQIRCKTKEIAVRDFINETFEGFYHDKPLWIGNCDCTHRRRIDHRRLINGTLLCIGTDEFQHKSYDKYDEEIRYDDLMMIHGGKFIYIRFNPDKYKENGINKNPAISTRLVELQKEIDKQIKRIENDENTELLEIIKMYYDI
jgi:hypothetical protein